MNNNYSPFKEAHDCYMALLESVEPRERLRAKQKMLEILTEANEASTVPSMTNSGAGRSKLVEALYKDIMNKKNVDYGKIPLSAGNITKVPYYKTMCESMDSLNQLMPDKGNVEMKRMNDLHNALIAERASFEFGFRAGVDIIQIIYCTLVEALMDIINQNIITFVDYLRETKNIQMPPRASGAKSENTVTRSVDAFLTAQRTGEWAKLVNYYKKSATKQFSSTVFSVMAIGTISVVGIIGLFWAIRALIYQYFYTAVTVDEKVHAMKMYIDATTAMEKDPKAAEKQKRASSSLQHIATFIETKILKDDAVAQREMAKSDQAMAKAAMTVNPPTANSVNNDLQSAPMTSNDEIEFSF